jgi:hypothetical protein
VSLDSTFNMKCKGFGPNHLETRCFSFQPLLTAARKGLFGLDEAEDDADVTANGSPPDKIISTGPAAAEVQKEDDAAKSERSVSCGEPGGGDTDSDFW